MKVLQVNSVCGIRSTGKIATDIATVLDEAGNDCKIAYGRFNAPKKYAKYAVRITEYFDVLIDTMKSRLFDNAGFNSKMKTKKFVNYLEEYDPDIVHLHNIHGYYINSEILFEYLKKNKKHIVWTLHDCWSFTGHCTYFDMVGCDKWKDGCYDCVLKKTYPKAIFMDKSRYNYEKKKNLFTNLENITFVTPSVWLCNMVKQSYLNKYDVKVIPNGIDLNRFKPRQSNFKDKYNVGNKHIILGVAMSWGKRKGLDDFYKLAEIIDDNFKIVLIGLSKDQIKNKPKNIIGISKTDSVEELAEIYTAADVFVNPTYEDNFPTVNLEALACGTYVVTYDTGGSTESIDEKTGTVVLKGDINNLKKVLVNLCDNMAYDKNECINRSRLYNKERCAIEYLNLYNQMNSK